MQFWTQVIECQLASLPKEQSQASLIYCYWHSNSAYPILFAYEMSPSPAVTTGMIGSGSFRDLSSCLHPGPSKKWSFLPLLTPVLRFHSFPPLGLKFDLKLFKISYLWLAVTTMPCYSNFLLGEYWKYYCTSNVLEIKSSVKKWTKCSNIIYLHITTVDIFVNNQSVLHVQTWTKWKNPHHLFRAAVTAEVLDVFF